MKTAIIKTTRRSGDAETRREKIGASSSCRRVSASQAGYSLISLMAMMTLLAIAMMAVAPSVQYQVQREKELEAIRRGEEVAEAIRQYVNHYNGAKFPNSIDDLLEGIPYGTKKRQILRESAAIDPLSDDGKWGLVGVESKTMVNFARRVQNYNNGMLPSSENVNPNVVNKMGIFLTNLDTESEDDAKGADEDAEIKTDNTPFIGVVSQSKNQSFIAYYGIENYSKWVFTPLFRGASSTPTSRRNEGSREGGRGNGKSGGGNNGSGGGGLQIDPKDTP